MIAIRTDRLILRRFRPDDAADLFAYLHRPRARCFLSSRLDTPADAEAEAERRASDDEHVAVCLTASGRLIGDLFCLPEPPDTFSVGWNFNAAYGGAGYAHEAAAALFGHLFSERQARRLYAYVEEDNAASHRLCATLGMRLEGLFREFVSFVDDDQGNPIFENTMQYAILRREWAERSARG
ncbi:GNAT family protein [Methylobacterium sp. 092160098-2]|uniref:GNAT family N-acetyltransferase n=1 Tax=Methylobacterium TaxID=407 RepID=UPI002381B22A|nr:MULTISPECIES: GNAT family protein [Methylobacterium]MDE4910331.1 GNAT family protein [Methylobacterium sp. 092160098-2]MDH3028417.1 GNAT family protein [Methylobacterium fujisawaense]